jgi:signal transduction histidine kinase
LRAPLRVLDGYARALVEDYGEKLDDQGKLYLDRISRAARRMDRLTQDVLAYSRVSRMTLTLQPIDLESVIVDVIEQYPTLSPFKDRFEIRRPLFGVMGHPPLLAQCFSNLLENAVKFAEPTRPLTIVIRSESYGARTRTFIEDNGRGIAPENFERIFGLFERASSNDVEGTGVGLAIVKRAVDRMGGTVRVTSRIGEGTQFCVELLSATIEEKTR